MEDLKTGVWKISFKKKDGSIRNMTCTRDVKVIGEIGNQYLPKSMEKKNENSVSIFDIELKEWRSFQNQNLLSKERIIWK